MTEYERLLNIIRGGSEVALADNSAEIEAELRRLHDLVEAKSRMIQAQNGARDGLHTENARLRAALVGLVGSDDPDELRAMEAAMRLMPAPEADKAATINAIHALLAS